ncbi:MAG: carbohydrate ABC transporter permease [Chloroflexi bacterium]|nr:carbohydrate ABC transporter permease [Chloroflexota bacterium]
MLILSSLKPFSQVSVNQMWDLPTGLYLDNITRAVPLVAPNFLNSVLITVPAALISSFIGSLNGYVFAKWRFPYSNLIFMLILFGIFLPYQGILIPLVQVLNFAHLYGSIGGLIFVHCVFGMPITALMFRAYFVTVPSDMLDAARIDGAGFFGIYWWIMLPIAAPAFAVALIWQFTNIWNDFLLGVVVLSNPSLSPMTVAINNIAGSFSIEWNLQMAAAVLTALPTVLVYLLLGRLFMRGLLTGALKG